MIYHCCTSSVLRNAWLVGDEQGRVLAFRDITQLRKTFVGALLNSGIKVDKLVVDPFLRLAGAEVQSLYWFESSVILKNASGIIAKGCHREPSTDAIRAWQEETSLRGERYSWVASSVLIYSNRFAEQLDRPVFLRVFPFDRQVMSTSSR